MEQWAADALLIICQAASGKTASNASTSKQIRLPWEIRPSSHVNQSDTGQDVVFTEGEYK